MYVYICIYMYVYMYMYVYIKVHVLHSCICIQLHASFRVFADPSCSRTVFSPRASVAFHSGLPSSGWHPMKSPRAPLKGSYKGDTGLDIDIDVDICRLL